jgi:hypothetical protein
MSGLVLLQLWLQTLAFPDRVRREMMLHQTEPHLGLNDQDEVAQQRQDCNKNISELLDEFSAVRNASVRFVEQLSAQDLERTGVHPRIGIISLRELLHEWLYHDLNHVKQVKGLLREDSNLQPFG